MGSSGNMISGGLIKTLIFVGAIFSIVFFTFFTARDFPLGTDGDYSQKSEDDFLAAHDFEITCRETHYENLNVATWVIGVVAFPLMMIIAIIFRFAWIQRAKIIGRKLRIEKAELDRQGLAGQVVLETRNDPALYVDVSTGRGPNRRYLPHLKMPGLFIGLEILFLVFAGFCTMWVLGIRIFSPNVVRCHEARKSAVEALPVISWLFVFLLVAFMAATEWSYFRGTWVRFSTNPGMPVADFAAAEGSTQAYPHGDGSQAVIIVNDRVVPLTGQTEENPSYQPLYRMYSENPGVTNTTESAGPGVYPQGYGQGFPPGYGRDYDQGYGQGV